MNLFIAASHTGGRIHPVVEVVDDYESFSPGLLGNYPVAKVDEALSYYDAGLDYARYHGLTPVELVVSTRGRNSDDAWLVARGEHTHRVYRATSPDGQLRMVAFRDKTDVDAVSLGLLKPVHPHYPLEGVLVPEADVPGVIRIISDLWVYDLEQRARAGQFIFLDGIQWGVIIDDQEWESSRRWLEDTCGDN